MIPKLSDPPLTTYLLLIVLSAINAILQFFILLYKNVIKPSTL